MSTTITLDGDGEALTGIVACVVARFAEAEGLDARDVVDLAAAVGMAVDHARRAAPGESVSVTLAARSGGVDASVGAMHLAASSLRQVSFPAGVVDEVHVEDGEMSTLRFVKRVTRPDVS